MFINHLLEKKAQSNVASVTLRLLKKLNIPVTATTVVDTLEHHPHYPSLYSISDSLQKWKVENLALRVDPDSLEKIPTPFIAHSKAGGGNFILVNSVNGVVEYTDGKGAFGKPGIKQKSREEFKKDWDNIVLIAEKNEVSGEKEYRLNKRKELIEGLRIPFIIAGCLLLTVLYAAAVHNFFTASLAFLKFSGCIVAGLLLWFEVDKSNPVLQQICAAGGKTNCTAVLSSKQSKLFNIISWSEVGFFYFAGGFIYLLVSVTLSLPKGQLPTLALLSWLNLFALPYTVFSVFYQWRIAKQWCPLCLTVQAILVLEFVVCYFGLRQAQTDTFIPYVFIPNVFIPNVTLSLPKSELIPLSVSFLLPVFFWVATKKVYLNAQEGKRYQKELSKLKYNKEIFNTLLSKQKQITASAEGLGIVLGNPDATNTIIKVCNPYCGPCAKAHSVIDAILENNDDVKVQIIFMATNNENDTRAKPVKLLMALYEKNDEQLIKSALDDWYGDGKKDYDEFAKKYLLNGELQMQGSKLEAMAKWCSENGIAFTPTFFINGHQLPESYKIEDVEHLL